MTHEIQVNLSNTHVLISPDPAIVKVGDKLIWKLGSGLPVKLRWTVYFHHGSPFAREEGYPHRFEASEEARLAQLGPFSAEDPGDYKYGIRVEDPADDKKLADDDPRLVVQRG
jgi:hypothetical protein